MEAPRIGRIAPVALGLVLLCCAVTNVAAQASATISRVKLSVVAIGTLQNTRAPPFRFSGTGFVVGDGTLVVTNAHVLSTPTEPSPDPEVLTAMLPTARASLPEAR